MSFMQAVTACLTNYVGFSGRARRSEYWYFALFNFVVQMIAGFVGGAIHFPLLGTLVSLALLLPSIAAGVRRMHDTNRSGWWIIVPIANLIFAVGDTVPGANQYGPDPKAAPAPAVA